MLSVLPFDSIALPGARGVLLDRVQRRVVRSSNPIARLDGLWKGVVRDGDGERFVPFSILNSVPEREELVARLIFGVPRAEPVRLRLIEASRFTYVTITDPYRDPIDDCLQVTTFEGRWARNKLWGAYVSRPLGGGKAKLGSFSLMKVEIAGW